MAEFSTKVTRQVGPNILGQDRRVIYIEGQAAANSDTFTVNELTTVKGCSLMSSGGTAGTVTLATNVITVTNASNLAWSGLAWGI